MLEKNMLKHFGPHVYGKTLGETWIKLVKTVLESGEKMPDEKRNRLAVQCVVLKSESQEMPDELLNKYSNREFLHELIEMHFSKEEMHDFDIVPSFSDGPKSYHKRIVEGDMINYIVERLTVMPESKKAIMVFPTWDDYKRVLAHPFDDYLPCTVTIQFRMIEIENGWQMNTIWYSRSIDAYQKSHGNMAAIALIGRQIARQLKKKLECEIKLGSLTGFITDAHIYAECIEGAKKTIEEVKKNENEK